jgi:hypothetical protein
MTKYFVIALSALAFTLSGCTTSPAEPETAATESAAESLYGGFPVDPPAPDEVVLTITSEASRDYTMQELQDRATTTITITEPFVNRKESFRGVPLADLFTENGLQADQQVATIALNDYRYTDSVEAFTTSDGLLAVSRDGVPIPMDQGGPIRIVFPEGTPYFTFLDAWNWSLRNIDLTTDN